jgi:hypothetical protein
MQICHEQNEVSKTTDEQDEESNSNKSITVQDDEELIAHNENTNKSNDEVCQMKNTLYIILSFKIDLKNGLQPYYKEAVLNTSTNEDTFYITSKVCKLHDARFMWRGKQKISMHGG